MMKIVYAALIGAAAIAAPAQAVVVVSGSGTLSSTDALQNLRVSRDGVASTWAASKTFPGTTGSGQYHYDLVNGTFAANASQTVYYSITFNAQQANVSQPFAVAYLNSFNPTSISTNYLGDSGISAGGDGAGTPVTFQVVVGAGGSLLVNFSEVTTNNLPTSYTYTINAFSDANGGQNFPGVGAGVPEPATWAMMIVGFGLIGGAMRRRQPRATVRFA